MRRKTTSGTGWKPKTRQLNLAQCLVKDVFRGIRKDTCVGVEVSVRNDAKAFKERLARRFRCTTAELETDLEQFKLKISQPGYYKLKSLGLKALERTVLLWILYFWDGV